MTGAAKSGVAVVLSVAVLCCACSTARQDAPSLPTATPTTVPETGFEQLQIPLQLELPAGEDLNISNHYGDIHVRQSDTAAVQLTLFLQRVAGSDVQARIIQKTSGTDLGLVVNAIPDKSRKDVLRIDLVVFVPQKPRLKLTTKHGTIEVRKISNPLIDAGSDSGELNLTTSGVMRARSKTGRIRATVMQPGWAGESHIASDRGLVQVFFPLSANLHLRAHAGTSIRSEFELDIMQDDTGSRVELHRGDGSDALVVASRDGEVQLYSVVFNPADYPGK